ncbi:AAA family ATPase [Nocardiopsis sp. CNT-189]|uniref:AAA family ATPase n=1 Tax=Nocardiopsis oceanisediminis TaxID=2816862 RepID=UPI003B3A2F7B
MVDDLPYLLQHSPEIPGLLQQLYDERQRGARPGAGPGPRLILCGSAMSVMHELLSGTKPLRGRAVVDLRLGPFDYRDSRAFWRIADPLTALKVHAVLGGGPGYRPVASRPHPDEGFDSWLTRTLLHPGRAVYSRTETEYLLCEDPRITRHTLYYDILTAIAQGATTPSKVGAALERPRNAVAHPLDVLESTGYIRREQDILRSRHPVIRFNQLITLPHAAAVDQGFADQMWRQAAPTFNSKILGPHFEDLARDFTRRYAHTLMPGGLPGPVGTTEVADPAARTRHEVDVIALAAGQRPQSPRARIAFLGEAKATAARRGTGDLERLEHIRSLLAGQGHDTSGTVLALYSLHGFYPDLVELADRRGDVLSHRPADPLRRMTSGTAGRPTGAYRTHSVLFRPAQRRIHPRGRGEHVMRGGSIRPLSDSRPRTRGAPRPGLRVAGCGRCDLGAARRRAGVPPRDGRAAHRPDLGHPDRRAADDLQPGRRPGGRGHGPCPGSGQCSQACGRRRPGGRPPGGRPGPAGHLRPRGASRGGRGECPAAPSNGRPGWRCPRPGAHGLLRAAP